MEHIKTDIDSMILVGITTRTNNRNESNPETAKIGPLFASYLQDNIAAQIKHRATPGITYAAYTNYESDEQGDYTYFIGELVNTAEGQDLSQFTVLPIPAGIYQKFTTPVGKIPDIIINAWQAIWQMTPETLGGNRAYHTDFEVYDQRAANPGQAQVEIYIQTS